MGGHTTVNEREQQKDNADKDTVFVARVSRRDRSSSHFAYPTSLQRTQSSILSFCPLEDWHHLIVPCVYITLLGDITLSAGDVWETSTAVTMPPTYHVLLRKLITWSQLLARAHVRIQMLLNLHRRCCCCSCLNSRVAEYAGQLLLLHMPHCRCC